MEDKVCKCGCGEFPGKTWEYKRGHKPSSTKKAGRPERTTGKVVEAVETPQDEVDEQIEIVVNHAWLDQVFALLPGFAKIAAVDAALAALAAIAA